MDKMQNKQQYQYQCLKCGKVFYTGEKVKLETPSKIPYFKSPCCLSNFTSTDKKINQFLDKFLYVNTDEKYYEYKK